jgi:putative NADPH-quinone reductase
MRWLPPFAVHGTHRLSDEALDQEATRYGRYLSALADDGEPRV